MKSLGIDVGSSSIKVSLLDISTGACVASSTNPSTEMPIDAVRSGWAEQNPDMWWQYVCEGIRSLAAEHSLADLRSIGITYQMHGLVCVDEAGRPLRKAIIWCDSRAVEIGSEAQKQLGSDYCLTHTLNSPGNFTAAKLAWVRCNEPEIFAATYKFMLPGDYIAFRLSGEMTTTRGGLSEGVLWDFATEGLALEVCEALGIEERMIPRVGGALEPLVATNAATERLLGIPAGTPISYRAGDQPNNAFSLNVMQPGEIAATGGTSGVVYGVTAKPEAEARSRVNTFLHINHSPEAPRYGVLLCINGTGSLNSWVRRTLTDGMEYARMNELAEQAAAGSEGLLVVPFGNGAERMLENRCLGADMLHIDFNRHSKAHVLRAAQEGIACSFRYGVDIMRQMGLAPTVIRAGRANMFLSPLFVRTLASLCNVRIELYNTDGSLGAARGAALGAGLYRSREEAFSSLKCLETIMPDPALRQTLEACYDRWKAVVEQRMNDSN